MKSKVYVLLLTALLAMAAVSCGSEDDENHENEDDEIQMNTVINEDILGVWVLKTFAKGWEQIQFPPNEVLCSFNNNGTVEVKNETDVDLRPFINNGTFRYTVKSIDEIVINNSLFHYFISDSTLVISNHVESDGEGYLFVRQ